MTDDNLDEFESEMIDDRGASQKEGKTNFFDTIRRRPLFKLMAIMIVVALAIAGAMGAFSGPPASDPSKMAKAPDMHEPPGGKVSPFFAEQNKMANEQRVQEALQKGDSAMPTPIGQNADINEAMNPENNDPLKEFRAETERLRQELQQEQQRNNQQVQQALQQVQQKPAEPPFDDSLAQAMQGQMKQLMKSWEPTGLKVVAGAEEETSTRQGGLHVTKALSGAGANVTMDDVNALLTGSSTTTSAAANRGAMLVAAGTVNYAQLLTEANSDVQSPILAQILSGPLAGGRAIGSFQVSNDYLVLRFTIVNLKGKDYPVNILALDPDTTLAGMATEVDHRYVNRVLLPAAASFLSTFGSTLGQGGTTTTSTNNGIIVDQAKQGYKDALYAGLGSAGQSMSQFFSNEANQTKTLVRAAVGTPMGMFFLTSVYENGGQDTADRTETASSTPYGALASFLNRETTMAQSQAAASSLPYPIQGVGTLPLGQNGTQALRSGFYPYGTASQGAASYGSR